jgi:hypothetical protein
VFSAYGWVETVKLIIDRDTGRRRGFGLVEMTSGGNEAIATFYEKAPVGGHNQSNLANPHNQRQRQPRRGQCRVVV